MKRIEMIRGAQKLVDECTNVRAGENVLIVTDTLMSMRIPEVIAASCKERGAETVMMVMNPVEIAGNELATLGRARTLHGEGTLKLQRITTSFCMPPRLNCMGRFY